MRRPKQPWPRLPLRGDDDDCYVAAIGNKELVASGDVGPKLTTFLFEHILRSACKLDEDTSKTKEGKRLWLNSFGGCTSSMSSIVDLFEEAWDLSTVATGACMSAAVPIIAAGTPGKRYATWRTRFMLHPSWDVFESPVERAFLENELAEFKDSEDKYAAILARYCEHDKKWWLKKCDCRNPWYFGAKEALKHGIIDHIISDKIRIHGK